MSQKGSKGGAPSRKEEAEKGPLGKKGMPDDLAEIGIDSFKNIDAIDIKLNNYLREHTQDLESIIQDQMMLSQIPAYKVHEPPGASEAELASFTPEFDPTGIRRMLFQGTWNSRNQAYLKKQDRQDQDKVMVYNLIRVCCSAQVNALLIVNPEFMACPRNDPLTLYGIIKRLISARPDGNAELDRSKALGEWHTLKMERGERIVDFGRRAVKTFDRLTVTGIPEAEQPKPKQQAMRFIEGLDGSIPAFHGYKLYLINAKQQTDQDIYPPTLVDAIQKATQFEASWTANTESAPLTTMPLSAFGAQGPSDDKRTRGGKPQGKGKGEKGKTPNAKDKKDSTDKIKDKTKFEGECFNCGKYGHRKVDCRSKPKAESAPSQNTRYQKPNQPQSGTDKHVSFYSTFGSMHDDEDEYCDVPDHTCNVTIKGHVLTGGCQTSLPANKSSIQPKSTEAIFDTGATGTIITCADVLHEIKSCSPTVFKGLHGSLIVNKAGRLGDIGLVHFDDRAQMSIVSASDILLQGHEWEFQRGRSVQSDAFLVHTRKYTYRFQHRDGLYFCDLAATPEPRHMNAISPRFAIAHPAIVVTPEVTMLYTTKLPTTTANEASYSKREVARSAHARRLQAILGFPPDSKMITALRAGTFLNCDILPEDVTRAALIWGPSVPALKGRTVRERPAPPPQLTPSLRTLSAQQMHCDIMFVNRQPFLVSITHPIGMVLIEHVANLTAQALRPAIRKMFGAFGSRRITIVKFTSDNERGIAALAGDMSGMGVEVITVGPGQHDHTIERMIRHLKEVIRATVHSLPFLVPDFMMTLLVLSCGNKLNLFPSTATRTDYMTPLEAFTNRKMDLKLDTGEPTFTYCQVHERQMSNSMDPRTIGCLYAGTRMNGTGTHMFVNLATKAVIQANHYVVLPIPPIVITTVNGWAASNRLHTVVDPTFTYHDRDITHDAPDDTHSRAPQSAPVPENVPQVAVPLPDVNVPELRLPAASCESPPASSPVEIRGGTEYVGDSDNSQDHVEEISEPTDIVEELPAEIRDVTPSNVRTYKPPRPLEPREKSSRIRKPVDRLTLTSQEVPQESLETDKPEFWSMMSVTRALKLFPEKTGFAIESEVKSLLAKDTFQGVHMGTLTPSQKSRILRSIMNVTEKFLPTVDSNGNREIDKVKARFCVDGRAQVRADYKPEEIESPTASMAAIFTVAQLAAAERRFVMVGDVGSAYLNARMPMDNPDKILHMIIARDVADEMIRQDKSFETYRMHNGSILVRLNKALYGCIESAKLWYEEIAGTLQNNGFTANPRDLCVFNKDVKGQQFTIVVYVDDLKMTCANKSAVLEMERILLKTYGQFRTTQGPIVSYLGLTWDYSETGYVKVSQAGMIQDIVARREKTHEDRGAKLTGIPTTPGASYLFNRTPDCKRLGVKDAEIFHTDTASLAWASTRAHPGLVTVIGELSKRVQECTTEDDSKLDRAISFAKSVRDVPLRLKAELPPRVTVSIDAAFANRTDMKSTSGTCITLGVGFFIASSKVQKLNSKSSTEAEIIAVSDGMNIPLWLADFIRLQGYPPQPVRLEQDNQSCITLLTKGRSTAETTRFIEIRKFWISAYIKNGAVDIVYVPTEDMTSDYFTKPLKGALFAKMFAKIMGQE